MFVTFNSINIDRVNHDVNSTDLNNHEKFRIFQCYRPNEYSPKGNVALFLFNATRTIVVKKIIL